MISRSSSYTRVIIFAFSPKNRSVFSKKFTKGIVPSFKGVVKSINILFSGGAVAVDLASRLENSTKIRCLMVENTFTSIPEVAKSLFNLKFVRCLPRWFYKNQFLSRFI